MRPRHRNPAKKARENIKAGADIGCEDLEVDE
jgi:hypothetical protein